MSSPASSDSATYDDDSSASSPPSLASPVVDVDSEDEGSPAATRTHRRQASPCVSTCSSPATLPAANTDPEPALPRAPRTTVAAAGADSDDDDEASPDWDDAEPPKAAKPHRDVAASGCKYCSQKPCAPPCPPIRDARKKSAEAASSGAPWWKNRAWRAGESKQRASEGGSDDEAQKKRRDWFTMDYDSVGRDMQQRERERRRRRVLDNQDPKWRKAA